MLGLDHLWRLLAVDIVRAVVLLPALIIGAAVVLPKIMQHRASKRLLADATRNESPGWR